jgi:uncharacterized membrane protein YhaH (DUF805 family)
MSLALTPFRRAFDYSGRSSRKEFFTFFWIFVFAIPVGFAVIYPATQGFDPTRSGDAILIAVGAYMLVVLIPTVSLMVRRFHDFDWSGWWLLFLLVPVLGIVSEIAALVWVEGTPGPNRFGPIPR